MKEKISDEYLEIMTDEDWLKIPYEQRLRITEFIFTKITEGPCSFRKLIYGRLGFTCDAYYDLYKAGGMDITNSITKENTNGSM